MKKGAKSSEPAAFLLFNEFISLKTSLTVGGIKAIVDGIFLLLFRKKLKGFIWLIYILRQSATNLTEEIIKRFGHKFCFFSAFPFNIQY